LRLTDSRFAPQDPQAANPDEDCHEQNSCPGLNEFEVQPIVRDKCGGDGPREDEEGGQDGGHFLASPSRPRGGCCWLSKSLHKPDHPVAARSPIAGAANVAIAANQVGAPHPLIWLNAEPNGRHKLLCVGDPSASPRRSSPFSIIQRMTSSRFPVWSI